MNYIVALLGVLGLYFVLTHWHVGENAVAFNAAGMSVTWFALLFIGGTIAVLKGAGVVGD
jgi:hypothetical protein